MYFNILPLVMGVLTLPIVMGDLTVKLVKVSNLSDGDRMGRSDPYVQLQLKKNNWIFFGRSYGTQVSSKKSNDLNPQFDETFQFKDVPSLKNMVLKIRIMDDDVGFDDKIGSCNIKLKRLKLSDKPREIVAIVDNKKLRPFYRRLPGTWLFTKLFRKKAKVHLELSYTE